MTSSQRVNTYSRKHRCLDYVRESTHLGKSDFYRRISKIVHRNLSHLNIVPDNPEPDHKETQTESSQKVIMTRSRTETEIRPPERTGLRGRWHVLLVLWCQRCIGISYLMFSSLCLVQCVWTRVLSSKCQMFWFCWFCSFSLTFIYNFDEFD